MAARRALLPALASLVVAARLTTPNPPTKIVPTNIARLKLSGEFPMGIRNPPL